MLVRSMAGIEINRQSQSTFSQDSLVNAEAWTYACHLSVKIIIMLEIFQVKKEKKKLTINVLALKIVYDDI